MTAYSERVLSFHCAGQRLVGVASVPDQPQATGLVIVVGGPQYRAGSHRHFVEVSRHAASLGFPALRFDARGMGDSEGELRSFEGTGDDIGAAIEALLGAVPAVHQVVLWGLCDGASAALLYLDRHPDEARVAGLCLLNPWVRSETSLAQVHVKHYYRARLRQPEFWQKLLTGQVAWTALRDLVDNLGRAARGSGGVGRSGTRELPFQKRMARSWRAFPRQVLLVLCSRDHTAREFLQVCESDPAWHGTLGAANVRRLDLATADHTLSDRADRVRLDQVVGAWLAELQHMAQVGRPRASREEADEIKT